MVDSNPIINKDELNQATLQEALEAIQANQLNLAHRLLLRAVKTEPQDVQISFLLGWTASTADKAAFYFQRLLELHPGNPLARELAQRVSHKSANDEISLGSNIGETKKLIARAIAHLERLGVENQNVGSPLDLTERNPADKVTKPEQTQLYDGKVKQLRQLPGSKVTRRFGILTSLRIPLAYLAALTLAEAITTLAIPQIGLIFHGMLLVIIILHAALFARHGLQKFLMTLTLAPLIRLMSLSLPLIQFPLIYWYALIGAPLLLAGFLVLRMTGFKADRIGLNLRKLPWQLVVGLTGLIFGFVEYLILRPAPMDEALSWQQILLPALILLIFTGFLEEFVFRGLIQRGAYGIVGHYSLLYVAVLFAVLHLGYRSVWDVVFVFVVGLFFGLVVNRTGSILGVTLSHGLTNISLYLVIPFLMNAAVNPVAEQPSRIIDAKISSTVWTMPGRILGSIFWDEGNLGVVPIATQWGVTETTPGLNYDGAGAKSNVKSQSRIADYGTYQVREYPRIKITPFRPVRIPVWD